MGPRGSSAKINSPDVQRGVVGGWRMLWINANAGRRIGSWAGVSGYLKGRVILDSGLGSFGLIAYLNCVFVGWFG